MKKIRCLRMSEMTERETQRKPLVKTEVGTFPRSECQKEREGKGGGSANVDFQNSVKKPRFWGF